MSVLDGGTFIVGEWDAGEHALQIPAGLTDRTGLTLLDRNVALLAALRDGQLVTRATVTRRTAQELKPRSPGLKLAHKS